MKGRERSRMILLLGLYLRQLVGGGREYRGRGGTWGERRFFSLFSVQKSVKRVSGFLKLGNNVYECVLSGETVLSV